MTQNSLDLQRLMHTIDRGYQFTPATYHALPAGADPHLFGIHHSLLHMNKATGVIAAELERHDHDSTLDHPALELAVKKEFVNVLKLAAHLGLTAEDLAAHVRETYGD